MHHAAPVPREGRGWLMQIDEINDHGIRCTAGVIPVLCGRKEPAHAPHARRGINPRLGNTKPYRAEGVGALPDRCINVHKKTLYLRNSPLRAEVCGVARKLLSLCSCLRLTAGLCLTELL